MWPFSKGVSAGTATSVLRALITHLRIHARFSIASTAPAPAACRPVASANSLRAQCCTTLGSQTTSRGLNI